MGKRTGEMRISKHARCPPPIHPLRNRIRIGLRALTRQLALTHRTSTARNLETRHNPIPLLHLLNRGPDFIHNPTKLMPKNITLLQLDDGAVQEVEIAAADGTAGDFENDIPVFDDARFGHVDHLHRVFAHPRQSLHRFRRVAVFASFLSRVGDILDGDCVGVVADGLFRFGC